MALGVPPEHLYRACLSIPNIKILGRNHVTFRAVLEAVPEASPWNSLRNWSPEHGGVGPGSPGLARGQVGAKMEGPRPLELPRPTLFALGQRGRF